MWDLFGNVQLQDFRDHTVSTTHLCPLTVRYLFFFWFSSLISTPSLLSPPHLIATSLYTRPGGGMLCDSMRPAGVECGASVIHACVHLHACIRAP